MKRRKRLVQAMVFGVGLAAAVALRPGPASSQTFGCRDIQQVREGKLVIGAIKGSTASETMLRRRITSALKMKFEHAGAELRSEAKVVFCLDRKVDKARPYDQSVSQVLNDRRVLVEVGAKLDDTETVVTFAVIPIRLREFYKHGRSDMEGFHEAIYRPQAQRLRALFQGNQDLRLMTALALGALHEEIADALGSGPERDKELGKARAFYCDAVAAAEATKPTDQDFGLAPEEWEALARYARESVERAMRATLDDAASRSALTIVDSERARDAASEESRAGCLEPARAATPGAGGG